MTFTRSSARAAIDGYRAGITSARTARAALAFLIRNPVAAVALGVAAGRTSRRAGLAQVRALAS